MSSTLGRTRLVLYRLYAPLVVVLAIVVPAGYYLSLRTAYPGLNSAWLYLLAVAAFWIVILLVTHTGRSIYAAARSRRPLAIALAVASFLTTLAVSAFGAFSAGMLLFEGPVIAREMLTLSRQRLLALEAASGAALRTPELDQVRSRVASWQSTFEAEIDSPAFCGVGSNAKAALSEIQKDLPSVNVLRGTDTPVTCSDKARLNSYKQAYRKMIADALAQHPLTKNLRVAERQAAQQEVARVVSDDRARIDAALARLDRIHNFIGRLGDFDEMSAVLSRASSDYAALYQRVAGLVGAQRIALPADLDNGLLLETASGFQVVGVAMQRLDRLSTWLYIAIAFGGDIIVVLLAVHALYVNQRLRDTRERVAASLSLGSGVQFIWSPVLSPSRPVATDPEHA